VALLLRCLQEGGRARSWRDRPCADRQTLLRLSTEACARRLGGRDGESNRHQCCQREEGRL